MRNGNAETARAQRADLIGSRARLESKGEAFGCARCGEALPPVALGHVSDYCGPCDDENERRDAEALAIAEGR
jgi:hypothetical protein